MQDCLLSELFGYHINVAQTLCYIFCCKATSCVKLEKQSFLYNETLYLTNSSQLSRRFEVILLTSYLAFLNLINYKSLLGRPASFLKIACFFIIFFLFCGSSQGVSFLSESALFDYIKLAFWLNGLSRLKALKL